MSTENQMSVESMLLEATLDDALRIARKIDNLESDPHPGLFTWQEANRSARAEFKAVLDKYKSL